MNTMAKKDLEFKKVELNLKPAWITGKGTGEYLVVRYGKNWFCYVHEIWQSNWGNSCFHNRLGKSVEYKTRREAQKAAEEHFKNKSEKLSDIA